jgi:hypothetical protein
LERRKEQQLARLEPTVSNESLVHLARLATTRKPTYVPRIASGGRKRTALFVGSGVFAASAAAFLTFFMVGTNSSIGRAPLPLVASIEKPIPQKVLPWQNAAPQPTQTTVVKNEPVTPAAADMEVEAEAASEQFEVEPGHPPPPQPNPPPGPSEPPQYDASGMPIEE